MPRDRPTLKAKRDLRHMREQCSWAQNTFRVREIDALMDYCRQDDALNLEGFCFDRGYSIKALQSAAISYDDLGLAYELAITKLAARRDAGCVTRKYDASYGKATFPLYCQRFRNYQLERAKGGDQGVTINLVKQPPFKD